MNHLLRLGALIWTMLALILCALVIVIPSPAHAQADTWTSPDKKLHFAGSGIAGAIAGALLPEQPFAAWLWSQVPGLIKEATDPVWSWKDMGVNALGGALGVALGRGFFVTPTSITYSKALGP